jgi:2-keto-3-deoxy-L-fuconate dehydrogenase
MNRLGGKRCLVTAAGAGIGRASALALAREGAEVWATDVSEAALLDLAADWEEEAAGGAGRATGPQGDAPFAAQPGGSGAGRILTRRLDVLDPLSVAEVAAALEAAGGVQVLFNCAGYVHHGTILDCDQAAWDFSVALNMTAMYRMCRALIPLMLSGGGGSIINMASVASGIIAAPSRFVYGATKAGVVGLTKAIAADYVAQGIRANAICPGTVDTPSLEGRMRQSPDYEAARRAFVARQPMGRLGRPEEIAYLVVYLASDESAYTTGTEQIIDGGWTNT